MQGDALELMLAEPAAFTSAGPGTYQMESVPLNVRRPHNSRPDNNERHINVLPDQNNSRSHVVSTPQSSQLKPYKSKRHNARRVKRQIPPRTNLAEVTEEDDDRGSTAQAAKESHRLQATESLEQSSPTQDEPTRFITRAAKTKKCSGKQ